MKKIVSSLLLAAKAIGLKFTEEETQKLEAIENEDELLPYFDKLSNQIPVFATEQKKAGHAEIYNSMDSKLDEKLEKLKDFLGEDKYNRIKSTQGVAKLGMLADDAAEAFDLIKKAKTTGSTEDGKAANAMIIELTGKLKTVEESGKTALEAKEKEVVGRYETRLMNEALFTKVSSVKDIAGEYAKEEIIRGVMIPKVHSLAKSKKLTISRTDDGSFELLNEQGTPHVDGAKHYGIDDLLLDATRDYARKSDGGGGQQGTFDPGKGSPQATSSVADQWQTESMG